MLLPRSTQLPCGVKDAKVKLLADSTRSSMGLWSYILRLTLLVNGKQKKSRAASCETARVFQDRNQPVSRIGCCFSSLSIQGFDQGYNWPSRAWLLAQPCRRDIAELVSPNSFNPGKKNLEALLLEGLVIDSCEAVAFGIVRQRVRRAGIIYVTQLDEYLRDAPVAQRHGLRYVDLPRVEVGRVHPAGVIHAPDFDDVAAVRSLPSALEPLKFGPDLRIAAQRLASQRFRSRGNCGWPVSTSRTQPPKAEEPDHGEGQHQDCFQGKLPPVRRWRPQVVSLLRSLSLAHS
jgi:hypothetical protein